MMVVLLGATLLSQPARADFVQQGPKLVGSGAVGPLTLQGQSVALSADGNTAIVGGDFDNSDAGAVWVWTRSGQVWTQQGSKLVGTGAVGSSDILQGFAVALSGDGDTAIVGGVGDNAQVGAVWVWTRSGGVWTQQGSKLVGNDVVGKAQQGVSVALSADGNTAIVGGGGDNGATGAAWVYTRSGGVWSQQGSKLVGTGGSGLTLQGQSVALSADGNAAIVGGINDNGGIGATWVFTRSGDVWTQQGDKLVGTGAVGSANQGSAVALSSDGNTAIVVGVFDDNSTSTGSAWAFTRSGGVWTQQGSKLVGTGKRLDNVALSGDGNTAIFGGQDNTYAGEVLVFTRSGGVWTQQGSKLVGTGAVGNTNQGFSVALSADGTTAIEGGTNDNSGVGAVWVFVQSGAPTLIGTHDFNGDGKSDILWRNSSSGEAVGWMMNGSSPVYQYGTIGTMSANWQIVAQRDFDGDGRADILWRDNSAGTVVLWLMNSLGIVQSKTIYTVATNWVIAGVADVNGDGKADIVWRDSNTGKVVIWLMNGGTVTQAGTLGTVSSDWVIAGVSFDGHIIWRNSTNGAVVIWVMNGIAVSQAYNLGVAASTWAIVGSGDFDGNGSTDLLWRNSNGAVAIWFLTSGAVTSTASLGVVANTWSIDLTGDFDGDGKSDIVWTNTTTGDRSIWFMNGATVASTVSLGIVNTTWAIQSMGAE
jgi:hypothetical protein